TYASAKKLNANVIVETNAKIGGIPLSQHTRETLAAAVSRAILEAGRDDVGGGGDDQAPSMAKAVQSARKYSGWARKNGAPEMRTKVHMHDGRPWVTIMVPADELEMLIDDDRDDT